MIVCKKCGLQNPLGRVFCGGCGGRLDIGQMTTDGVRDSLRTPVSARLKPILGWAVVLALVAMAALALFPQRVPLGKGTREDGSRAASHVRLLGGVRKGQTLAVDLTEEGINGYLEYVKGARMGVQSLSVKMRGGVVAVRMVTPRTPPELFGWRVPLKFSCDLRCVPVGGRLQIRGAAVGRLWLIGPLRALPARWVSRQLESQPEWRALMPVDEVRAGDGTLWVKVVR